MRTQDREGDSDNNGTVNCVLSAYSTLSAYREPGTVMGSLGVHHLAFHSIFRKAYGEGYLGAIQPKEKPRLGRANDHLDFHVEGGLQPRFPPRGWARSCFPLPLDRVERTL